MNAKHVLTHLVRQAPRQKPEIIKLLSQHIRETLSKEQLTQAFKQRLVEQHRREVLALELIKLEQELLEVQDTHSGRVQQLKEKIKELKKKV